MSKSSKEYRAHFSKKGLQSAWIAHIRDRLSVAEIASLCSCSERTIRDWQREKFCMDYVCLETLCEHLSLSLPEVKKVARFAHTQRAGKKGGRSLIHKYGKVLGDESLRKKRWEEWWEGFGKGQSVITQPKKIVTPRKSADLAEFVGIVMGDGGLSEYQLTITLHTVDDKAYGTFVKDLIERLFSVTVSVRSRKNMCATDYKVSRIALVRFCVEKLGLKKGNKLNGPLTIPMWIKKNKKYARACVRGLMDTDGSVFTHTYNVKGKKYSYKKLCFTSASPMLCQNVVEILKSDGIATSCYKTNVRIENSESVTRYFQRIGSHNPKHLKRLTN